MVAKDGCSYLHGVFFRINFAHGQLFCAISSSGFTVNHWVIYFLVLRGLRNDDNTRVSALQIVLRPSQVV